MKKTQSLKLMLVGLLCSMGMSAWAADGDIFTDKKLVLQEKGGFAQVIAVASHDGTIVIPDEVKNDFDNDKVLKINKLAEGWWAGGELWLKRNGGKDIKGSTVAENLLDGGLFTLKLEATKLTSIAMQEIIPVNSKISSFIVDPAAGLNMLPEHAFQKNKWIIDQAKTQANKTAWDTAVAKAEDALKGKDEEVCFIQGGKFQGKQVYVYAADGTTGSLVVLGEAVEGQKDAWGEQLYKVLEIHQDDGTTEEIEGVLLRAHTSGEFLMNDGEDKPIAHKAEKYTGEDKCMNVHTNSPAEAVAAAELAKEQADLKAEQAHKDAVIAEAAALDPDSNITPEKLAKKAAAERLEAAILAFQENKSWPSLQKRVSMKTGTNVELVDAWTAAYVLANDPDNTLLGLTKPEQWAPLTEEFIEAYTEFYGKEPRIVSEMKVQSYTFNSFGATGDIFHAGQATVDAPSTQGASQITFTPWANGLVEDRSQYDNYDVDAQAAGYYQIKVLENSVDGWVDKYFYVKVAPEDIDEDNTYYVLYQKNEQGQIVPVGTLGEVTYGPYDVKGSLTLDGSAVTGNITAQDNDLTPYDNYTFTASYNNGSVFFTNQKVIKSTDISALPAEYYIRYNDNNKYKKIARIVVCQIDNAKKVYALDVDGYLYEVDSSDVTTTYGVNTDGYPGTGTADNQEYWYVNAAPVIKESWTETTGNYSEVAVVKIKKDQLMTVARILPVPTEIDAFNPSGDIRAAIAAGTADQDALDAAFAKAKEAEAAAKEAQKKAKQDLAAAKKNLKDLQDALKKLQDDGYETAYMYEFGGDNTWLTNVQWDNDGIKDFGAYAFKDCINANFSNNGTAGLFPSVTSTIGDEAFLNCKKLDADLKNTNATISEIGDAAFKNTKTTTVALKDATKLDDGKIGDDVWDNTPMKTINLLNTQLTEMPEGLAEDILRGEQAKDCDNKAIEGAFINTTLTSVVMPKGTTKVRAKNFWFCVNLASVTPIPVGITEIGDYAFAGTALTGLDLTALTKLLSVGDAAFAYNEALKYVRFAPESPFKSIEGNAFKCDFSLEEIELNDSVKCLEAGLFADTKIKKLDLSNTQVEVLPDLFWGSAEKVTASKTTPNITSSLTTILLPETKMNATNDEVVIPGLKIIGNHAFAYLQGITKMTIPSSVWAMGTEVFAYCGKLKTVTAMDSRLTNLGAHTFRGCTSLTKFTFVTLQRINPDWTFNGDPRHLLYNDYYCGPVVLGGQFEFDDYQFDLCNENNGTVKVVVTEESRKLLEGQYYASYNGITHYSDLVAYKPTLTLTKEGTDDDGNTVYSDAYYNSDYGTWIPVDEATVYTAYQDLKKVYLFKAKHNDGYYKIPAVNWTGEKVTSTAPYWLAKGAVQENFLQWEDSDAPITDIAQGSAAVIIMTSKADGTFKYERHSAPGEKYQSTLDRDNELKIAGKALVPNITSRVCVWAKQEGNPTFYRLDQENMVIPKGKVVFPSSTLQGGAMTSRLEVVIVNDEVTSIKDFMKAMNDSSDAIYNLQGVRVSTPQKGQLYIQGGKKFIQK